MDRIESRLTRVTPYRYRSSTKHSTVTMVSPKQVENISWSTNVIIAKSISAHLSLLRFRFLDNYLITSQLKYRNFSIKVTFSHILIMALLPGVQLQAFILNVCQNFKSAQPAIYCMPSFILLLRYFNSSDGFRSRIE